MSDELHAMDAKLHSIAENCYDRDVDGRTDLFNKLQAIRKLVREATGIVLYVERYMSVNK